MIVGHSRVILAQCNGERECFNTTVNINGLYSAIPQVDVQAEATTTGYPPYSALEDQQV